MTLHINCVVCAYENVVFDLSQNYYNPTMYIFALSRHTAPTEGCKCPGWGQSNSCT